MSYGDVLHARNGFRAGAGTAFSRAEPGHPAHAKHPCALLTITVWGQGFAVRTRRPLHFPS